MKTKSVNFIWFLIKEIKRISDESSSESQVHHNRHIEKMRPKFLHKFPSL